jgi:antitoxin PrlF
LPVFRRQAPTTAGAVLLGKTQLQLDRPLIPRPYRNFHSFQVANFPLHCYLFLTRMIQVRILEIDMSTEATLTSKGQTTIPKPIRDGLGIKAGDRMTFTLMPDGVVVMRVKNKHVSDLAGLLHKKGRKAVPTALLSR